MSSEPSDLHSEGILSHHIDQTNIFEESESKPETKKRGKTNKGPSSSKKKKSSKENAEEKHSRYDSSLGLLTKKFLGLVRQSEIEDSTVDLNDASKTLGVQKRRIYDITNVLEGIGLIEKKSKNRIHWKASGVSTNEEKAQVEVLKEELEKLRSEEAILDDNIRNVQGTLKSLVDDTSLSKYTFVTHDDIRNLPSMSGQTLIAIKAPAGTRLEVPDPDEGMSMGKRRYQIFLRSESGAPIDVYLVSQESQQVTQQEEEEEEVLIGESDLLLETNSTPIKKGMMSPDAGLLKLQASPVQMDPDYYLVELFDD